MQCQWNCISLCVFFSALRFFFIVVALKKNAGILLIPYRTCADIMNFNLNQLKMFHELNPTTAAK